MRSYSLLDIFRFSMIAIITVLCITFILKVVSVIFVVALTFLVPLALIVWLIRYIKNKNNYYR